MMVYDGYVANEYPTEETSVMKIRHRVECTEHDGAHTGMIAHVIVPGVGYGVAWDARNMNAGMPGHEAEAQYPQEFLKAGHAKDLVWCDAEKVRAA